MRSYLRGRAVGPEGAERLYGSTIRDSMLAATTGIARLVVIRDFVPADRPFLERGLLAELKEAAPFDPLKMIVPPRNWGRTHSTFLLNEVRKTRGHLLVAELGAKRAGFLVGTLERPSRGRSRSFAARHPGWILEVYVAPAFRNRGVA